ncbi:MAG TPA: hypothetical protein VIN10_13515 [Bacteroidales bacterium]
MMIFLRLECNVDTDETSLLTGDCEFSEIVITFIPNPVNIIAGNTIEVEVQVAVQSNCDEYLKSIWVSDISDYIALQQTALCGTNSGLTSNRGACSIGVTVEPATPVGTIQKQYKITVCSEEVSTEANPGNKKSAIATLDVNVLAAPDYRLAMAPPTIGVIQGSEFSITASIERLGGHSEDITMSMQNLPQRLTYIYEPNPIPGDENSSQLTITAEPNAVPGEYSIRAICTDGTIERFVNFPLYVIEPFTLSINPATISISQGQAGTVDVNVENRIGGFSDWVMLSIENAIIGQGTNQVDTTFNPNPIPPIDVHTSELTLSVGESVPPGSYTIIIRSLGGNVQKTAELQMTVTEQNK